MNFQVKLIVPSKSKNFGCHSCTSKEIKFLPDGRTIIVNKVVSQSINPTGFYWSIIDLDPRGKYKLILSIEGKEIETYDFEVQ